MGVVSTDARPHVTVVIPTYQRRTSLRHALEALSSQTMSSEDFEVVVSIDGSIDGTQEMLARFPAPYRLTTHWQPNRGRAAACNTGIRMARGELIVLLDDDMQPAPEFLQAHAAAHMDGRPRAVMGAAPIVEVRNETPATRYVRRKFNQHLCRLAEANHAFALRDFYSGNLSVPRAVLLDAQGFDEGFTIYGNEDIELWWRLQAAGIELTFSETALAHQHYTKNFRELARDHIAKGRTAVLLVSKHPATRERTKLDSLARQRWLKGALLHTLLAMTRLVPATLHSIIAMFSTLDAARLPGLTRAVALVLDYCYFAGAQSADEQASRDGRQAMALP